jgi:hypothetical protein
MDIAFLSHDRKLLLGCIKAKNLPGKLSTAETRKAIQETILYSVVPLAYSLWGRITKKIVTVVSLLVFPGCVYQLKFTKSARPLGFELSIERSDDIATMEHILDNYVQDFSDLYWNLEEKLVDVNEKADPQDWSPVNFDFERGVDRKFSYNTEPSLGFLFWAKVETVKSFISNFASKYSWQGLFCSMLPEDGEEVLLKYYSAMAWSAGMGHGMVCWLRPWHGPSPMASDPAVSKGVGRRSSVLRVASNRSPRRRGDSEEGLGSVPNVTSVLLRATGHPAPAAAGRVPGSGHCQ